MILNEFIIAGDIRPVGVDNMLLHVTISKSCQIIILLIMNVITPKVKCTTPNNM